MTNEEEGLLLMRCEAGDGEPRPVSGGFTINPPGSAASTLASQGIDKNLTRQALTHGARPRTISATLAFDALIRPRRRTATASHAQKHRRREGPQEFITQSW